MSSDIERLRAKVRNRIAALPVGENGRLRAVLLFGSRSRGDQAAWSDWDLCALWNGRPPPRAGLIVEHEGAAVDWLDFDADEFEQEARRIGTLQRLAAKHGIVLFGSLPMDIPQEGEPVNQLDWIEHFDRLASCADAAVSEVEKHVDEMDAPWRNLIKESSNFAEHVAKLALDLKGIDARKVHDVQALAQQWPSNDEYKRRIDALDGETHADHLVPYGMIRHRSGADNTRAVERINDSLALLRDILEDPEVGGCGIKFERVSEADHEWAQDRCVRVDEQWAEHVVGPLRRLVEEGRDHPRTRSMLGNAEAISAWGRNMTTEIRACRA